MSSKPIVFISSTIYDFQDLRSALRFWLEEMGCEVRMSEGTDFPVNHAGNSYESCLEAIEGADYFILLVGSRVGGMYSTAAKTSITRKEYQHALQLFEKTGKPRILSFVRKAVWDVREDRTALGEVLKNDVQREAMTEARREEILCHPSKLMDDASHIIGFISEICRANEMKAAVKTGDAFPGANWLYQFSGFSDIIDALRWAMGFTGNAEAAMLRRCLRAELVSNINVALQMYEKEPMPLPISDFGVLAIGSSFLSGGLNDSTTMSTSKLNWLIMFCISSMTTKERMSKLFIERGLESGIFMHYCASSKSYLPSSIHSALLELRGMLSEEGVPFPSRSEAYVKECEVLATWRDAAKNRDQNVPNLDLVSPFLRARALDRIVKVSVAIVRALDGNTTSVDNLSAYHPSPFQQDAREIAQRRPTIEQAEHFISSLKIS